VTNHMVMGDDGKLRPALGESWKAVPHARVLVEKAQESSQCIATLGEALETGTPTSRDHTTPHRWM